MKFHAMNDCEQFQKLSYEERKDFLLKNRMCLEFFSSKEDVSKDCKRNKLECKIWKQMCATILCMTRPNIRKKTPVKLTPPVLKFAGKDSQRDPVLE